MQVSMDTDYAISVLCLIAQRNDFVKTSEIIRTVGGSGEYMRNLLALLKRSAFIDYVVDKKNIADSGYVLKKQANEITVLDVVNITEKTMSISRSLRKDTGLCHSAMDHKKVTIMFGKVRKNILHTFASTTIADFLCIS